MKKFSFKIRGNKYDAVINSFEKNIVDIDINGTNYKVEVEQDVTPIQKPKTPKLVRAKVPTKAGDENIVSKKAMLVKAPLPGTIISINCKQGNTVNAGDTLLVMEAMKMENNIQAEATGKVKSIMVAAGESVLQGDILIEME